MSVNTSISSFDDFLPSSAITSPPSKLPFRSSASDSSSGSRLTSAFRRVKVMNSVVLQLQDADNAGSSDRIKSSLPNSAPSDYLSRGSPPPPKPTWRTRGYSKLPDPRQEEDKKSLLRSKTMSSVSSSRSSRNAPTRSSSRASRASAVSTASTITPMKTR